MICNGPSSGSPSQIGHAILDSTRETLAILSFLFVPHEASSSSPDFIPVVCAS